MPAEVIVQARSGERYKGELAAMHLHLHRIEALAPDESLTAFGRIARYFPQSGGMVFARMLVEVKQRPLYLVQAHWPSAPPPEAAPAVRATAQRAAALLGLPAF